MPKKKRKRKGLPFLDFLMFGTTVVIGLSGLSRKAGGIVEPPDEPPIRPPPIRPPPIDTRIQDCINAGGVWNEQFHLCEFPTPMPSPVVLLLPIGTRVLVKENCGVSSGLSGVVAAHIFQTSVDVRRNLLSMQVDFDDPPPFRNAYRALPEERACLLVL